ncbi:MAG: sulfite exporter TauE/SafE family protein [Chthonomonas sp.]|nr:sulfite exporter TauE/SafE family protein [Chthonomonas sp.]
MGILLGLFGGGGGILTVPILTGLFGLSATSATGNSLFIVGVTSLVGATSGVVRGQTQMKAATLLALPSMAGAVLARKAIIPNLPAQVFWWTKDQLILAGFGILMLLVGFKMLWKPSSPSSQGPKTGKVLTLGFGIGLISGTLGAGGGFLILPVLTLLMDLPMEQAIPTSLLVIALQSIAGFASELSGSIPWSFLLAVTSAALVGLTVGIASRHVVPVRALRVAFAYLVISVGALMIFRLT